MSVTNISEKNKFLLWGKAAGRCQYRGCNRCMYEDGLTKAEFNQAYIAHIVADSPNGPRGDVNRSKSLADDLSNLMLLCDTHHRLIDKHDVKGHPESLLIEMKTEHEEKVKNITGIAPNMISYIVTYTANIGEHHPIVTYDSVSEYLYPTYYPAQNRDINLSLTGSYMRDKNQIFWEVELENLQKRYDRDLLPLINDKSIKHVSLFPFAPIPLLIKIGTLIGDKVSTDVRQYDRNVGSWNFSKKDITTEYKVSLSEDNNSHIVALNLSLSGTISNDRITSVLGEKCTIYTLTIDEPNNGYLISKKQLDDFTFSIRKLFNEIKLKYGSKIPLHIFPAMPIATAVELGRYWMPKADMPLIIYDENKLNEGFLKAIEIN